MHPLGRNRAGRWLPKDPEHLSNWISDLISEADANPRQLIKPIQELKEIVDSDLTLNVAVYAMFAEAIEKRKYTPLGTPELKNFDQFLVLLNHIMHTAPEFTECKNNKGGEEPCGLIGFPINALLDWPMATDSGYVVFANSLFNQQFKRILVHWSKFLVSQESRYVLVDGRPKATPKVIPWLSEKAKKEMVNVACEGIMNPDQKADCNKKSFEEIFNCNPKDPYYGFKSWDDFFTRTFRSGVRPVASPEDPDVIVNACESAPLQVKYNVNELDTFWLKGQAYSLKNMMAWDPWANKFKGGTVYQAFLSALSFHRWNSPVSGTIKKAYVIDGSYYLENLYQGFRKPGGADPSAPNDSQPFLTAVATRALIFIESDNPKIGLMCFMAVGMAEVSSCQITVKVGQQINKGEQLGMFHFGGSTHCLIFRPEVNLDFYFHHQEPGLDSVNIPVNSRIASVI